MPPLCTYGLGMPWAGAVASPTAATFPEGIWGPFSSLARSRRLVNSCSGQESAALDSDPDPAHSVIVGWSSTSPRLASVTMGPRGAAGQHQLSCLPSHAHIALTPFSGCL